MTNDNYTGPYNRVSRLVCLATPTDAQHIKAAADEARMTVSTFLLMAGLGHQQAGLFAQAIGIMSTIKPDMLVDVNHPVEMALEVYDYVSRLKTRLHEGG